MSAPHFQPRKNQQLFALLERILERVHRDVPDAIGLTISMHGKRYNDGPVVAAEWGAGSDIVVAQLSDLGGPLPDALRHEVPVLSLELWTDDRWPDLTLESVTRRAPKRSAWSRSLVISSGPMIPSGKPG